MLRPTAFFGCIAVAFALSACSGGSRGGSDVTVESTDLRIASSRTGGGSGDALAASLIALTGRSVDNGTLPPVLPGAALVDELGFRALSHLDVAALTAGAGMRLEGSARIRALARRPGAPPDRNGNGTNLDETMAADRASLAEAAGAAVMGEVFPILFPWSDGTADFDDASRLRTRKQPPGQVSLEQVADAMLARVRAASLPLRESRGKLAGRTADEGLAGLLRLQQVVAIEQTLFESLFTDGRTSARFDDPRAYRPENGPRWLPAAFAMQPDRELPEAPAGYVPVDRASALAATARLLHAAVELGWLTSDANPYVPLRELVTGSPFGPVPGPPGQRRAKAVDEVTFDDAVGPLLTTYCRGCHSGPGAAGDFRVTSYEETLFGGRNRDNHPSVVPGDPTASLLWQVLVGASTVVPQMPLGGMLSPEEIAVVTGWIEGGAPRSGSGDPAERRLGVDLANVLVRNLAAMQRDAATGGMHHRHDGDAPSGFADAGSTGDALIALATYVRALPAEDRVDDLGERLLADLLAFAIDAMSDADGRVFADYEFALGRADGRADLRGHARLLEGLVFAGNVVRDARAAARARAVGERLLDEFFDPPTGLFATRLDRRGRSYRPQTIGDLATSLARYEPFAADPARVEAILTGFLSRIGPFLVFAESDRPGGEVVGDGVADTDGNGIPEPALAGGAHGRAPMFVGEMREGPGPADEPADAEVTWSRHILPLLRSKCAECHLGGVALGGYRIDTPTLLRTAGDSGGRLPLIVPGDPQASLFYRKLVDRNPPVGVQMPQARPPLDEHGRALVRDWILQGAKSR